MELYRHSCMEWPLSIAQTLQLLVPQRPSHVMKDTHRQAIQNCRVFQRDSGRRRPWLVQLKVGLLWLQTTNLTGHWFWFYGSGSIRIFFRNKLSTSSFFFARPFPIFSCQIWSEGRILAILHQIKTNISARQILLKTGVFKTSEEKVGLDQTRTCQKCV